MKDKTYSRKELEFSDVSGRLTFYITKSKKIELADSLHFGIHYHKTKDISGETATLNKKELLQLMNFIIKNI